MKSLDLTDKKVQAALKRFFDFMRSILSEKHFRLLLGACALLLGSGSITFLHEMSGASRQRISNGKREIESNDDVVTSNRTRRAGGGRRPIEKHMSGIGEKIADLINRSSYGNPDNVKARIYSAMSLLKMRAELAKAGIKTSLQTILRIVRELGFTKQINRKQIQIGKRHPDTDEQMEIMMKVKTDAASCGTDPVLSIDGKAKVPLLNLFQKGAEWRKRKDARKVVDHDFVPKKDKATPFGIYDIRNNRGFVNLGTSSDTAQFSVNSIRRWWYSEGKAAYSDAGRIVLMCDGGGSNGWRLRLWKLELAELADEIGIPIEVHHFPTGKSRFNPIEHRLFNHISMNWAGQPMTDLETVLGFIRSTKSAAGLEVEAVLDEKVYETGIRVTDEEFERINFIPDSRLGFWNYTVYGLHQKASGT